MSSFLKTLLLNLFITLPLVVFSQEKENPLFSSDTYSIMAWDFMEHDDPLDFLVDCNFTIGGFLRPYDFKRAEDLGLRYFVDLDLGIQKRNKHRRVYRDKSDEEIDNIIRMLVENSGKSDSILGYFIMDEPSSLDFPALGKAVKALKKYAPDKLAYINLFPNYATLSTLDQLDSQLGTATYMEYLERYVNEVKPEFISFDNYMVQFSKDLNNHSRAKSYFDNLLDVREVGLKYDLPYWIIVSSHQIRNYTTIPSLANMLFQAYTALAAGYNGVTWYQFKQNGYNYSPIDAKGNKTTTWYYLKEVNRQILEVGNIINNFKSKSVYFTTPVFDVEYEKPAETFIKTIECDDPLMVGEFESESGELYVLLVNISLEKTVRFSLSLENSNQKIFRIAPDMDYLKNNLNDPKKVFSLNTGSGVLVKIE
jgi:hypothetical protein